MVSEMDKRLLGLIQGMDLNNYPFDEESTIPADKLEELKACHWLNLKRNGLRRVPEAVCNLIELEFLSLAYNKVTEIDEDLEGLADSLRVLDLRWNRLHETLCSNDHLATLSNLTILDLSHNPLMSVPSSLEQLKQLQFLSLKNTKISTMPGSLFISLTGLNHLDVSNNELDSLPVQLRRLVSLKSFIISHNPNLVTCPLKQVSSMPNLEVLHMRNTGRNLENIPEDISKLLHLSDIDLGDNDLTQVPNSIVSCPSLKRLNVSDNAIETFPKSIDMWVHLETICFSRNKVSSLPAEFGKLINLRNLYMDSNELTLETLLEANLGRLTNLEVFSAAFNQLQSIPEGLCRCTKLKKINLMFNKLVNLPESIHFLTLQDLNVSENPNLVMPPKPATDVMIDPKAAIFYNIDFTVEGQLAKLRREQNKSLSESGGDMSHASSLDSMGASGGTLRRQGSTAGSSGTAGSRKQRIQKRKEEEAERSDATVLLTAMRKQAEKSKNVDVEQTNELAADFDETITKPKKWDQNLKGPVMDYSKYFEADIGEVEGVHVWYISNFNPILLDEAENGKFYQKDCYIILQNLWSDNDFLHNIYFWIGKDAEQDKQTCCAIHAVNLRNMTGASCRTVREDQDDESEEFLTVFSSTFEILEGGYGESGFNHFELQAANQYLYCLNTQSNTIGMHLVELNPVSLDPRYLFLLDMGSVLFIWVGNSTPKTQLSKAKLLAGKISKNERKGKARVFVVRQGAEPSPFWRGLLVENPETFSCKPEEWLNLSAIKKPNLYNVIIKQVDKDKFFELSAVEKTEWVIHESHLNTKAVHIVDAQTAVFVWEGRKSPRILRRAALQLANMLLTMIIRQDDEAGVVIEKQGFESEFFKSFFSSWESDKVAIDFTKDGHFASAANASEKRKETKANLGALFAPRAPEQNLDDLEYERLYYFDDLKQTTCFYFDGQDFVKLPESEFGHFYSGDCFVYVSYYVHPPEEDELDEDAPEEEEETVDISLFKHEFRTIFWQGREASNKAYFHFNMHFSRSELQAYIDKQIDKLKRALKLTHLDAIVEPAIYLNQQVEDIPLLISLNQEIVIHKGTRRNASRSKFEPQPRLYCVRSNAGTAFVRCIEIECSARWLNSAYCFILGIPFDEPSGGEVSSNSAGVVYIWIGNKAPEYLQNVARRNANKIFASKKFTVQEVMEGSEPDVELFWQFLGGRQDYEKDNDYMASVQLFRCSNTHGYFGVSSKYIDFCQSDLSTGDVMILDTGFNVFLWMGENSSDTVVRLAYKSAIMYMQHMKRHKPARLIATKKNFEPFDFQKVFHGWAAWPAPKFLR